MTRIFAIPAFVILLLCAPSALAGPKAHHAAPCTADTLRVPSCAAYAAYLSATLRSHAPSSTDLGEGVGYVGFKVLPSGRAVEIEHSGTSAAHIEAARRILRSVRFRPPPGPYALAGQSFYFH